MCRWRATSSTWLPWLTGTRARSCHRYVGWETEQAAIPNAAPVAVGLVIISPHSRLEIGSGQQICAWHFLSERRVQICTGPTHGDASDACMAYTLPE